jgi:hypothetical protein
MMLFAQKFMEKQMKITLVLAIPAFLAPPLLKLTLSFTACKLRISLY